MSYPMALSSQSSTARAILYAFVANFGIAIAKSWAAWLTGSGSMLAEASIIALERELKERISKLNWCFIEPDVTD
jgi:hypothetical protein